MALSALGRFDEAQSALASVEKKYSQAGAFQVAAVHAWRGDIDSAFEWLSRSYELHETGLVFVPIFKAVTHLPPFMGMMFSLSIIWIVSV